MPEAGAGSSVTTAVRTRIHQYQGCVRPAVMSGECLPPSSMARYFHFSRIGARVLHVIVPARLAQNPLKFPANVTGHRINP